MLDGYQLDETGLNLRLCGFNPRSPFGTTRPLSHLSIC